MREPRRDLWILGFVISVVAAWLVHAAALRPWSLAGDPWAVYFPAVQRLWNGEGIASFATLVVSGIRMPGFPLALAAVAAFVPDLVTAGQVVGVVSALAVCVTVVWTSRRIGASAIGSAVAAVVPAMHYGFVRAAVESLPDMLYLAFFSASLAVTLTAIEATEGRRIQRLMWSAGLLAVGGFLVRVNGLALLIAAPIGIRFCVPSSLRGTALRSYLAAVGLGLLPWIALIIAMQPYVGYPHIVVGASGSVASARAAGPVSSIAIAVAKGLLDQPLRIAAAMPWWLALVGLGTLVGALRSSAAARLVVIVGVAMGGLLVPMHFEGRYYLFAGVLIVPAAVIGIERLVRLTHRPNIRPVALVAACILAVALEAPFSIARNEREAEVGASLESVCVALSEAARGSTRPWLVGMHVDPRYSRFRACPRARREGNDDILTMRAGLGDRGLDAWVTRPGEAAPPGARLIAEVSGHQIHSTANPVAWSPAAAGDRAETVGLVVTTPHRQPCREREVQVPSGRFLIRAEVEVSRGVAALIRVTQGQHDVSSWTTASGRMDLGGVELVGGTATVSLCVGDRLAPGRVVWTTIDLVPDDPDLASTPFGPHSESR